MARLQEYFLQSADKLSLQGQPFLLMHLKFSGSKIDFLKELFNRTLFQGFKSTDQMVKKIVFINECAVQLNEKAALSCNKYINELCHQLVKYGVAVDLFIPAEESQGLPFCIEVSDGVRIIRLPARVTETCTSNFTEKILAYIRAQDLKYDLIQAHFITSANSGILLKQALNLPLVYLFQPVFENNYLGDQALMLDHAEHIVVMGSIEQQILEDKYGIQAEKISIIPFGIHPDEFYPVNKMLAKTVLGVDDTEKIVLHTNSFDDDHGLFNLIAAMGIMKRNKLNYARLIVLSDQVDSDQSTQRNLLDRYKKLVSYWGINADVNFIGIQHPSVLKYLYSASDLVVNTCNFEYGDLASLRAIACGTQVYKSVGGELELNADQTTLSYRIHQDRPANLALQIDQLLTDSDTQQTEIISKNQPNTLSWAEAARKLIRVYDITKQKKTEYFRKYESGYLYNNHNFKSQAIN